MTNDQISVEARSEASKERNNKIVFSQWAHPTSNSRDFKKTKV